ncbi:hypothetical protein NM208_g6105 [Fusarium decemcellulare]|uniref:Uncharacterized protein n=1 Tax=Fusarium decemcellulare TaxID=57161 RepID=A0ACC1SEE4_9HYPO|nr:hypothetical protein NM208_g6105 [Fusarium decemcellulare]
MAVNGEGDKKDKKDVPARQRKAHRKSRLGCSNCKLRSVKCDESKPSCKRCVASGFICSFTRNNPSTQLAHRSAGPVFSVADPVSDQRLKAPNPGLRIPIAQPTKGGVGELILGEVELAALERFRLRTVFTIGTEKTRHLYSQGAFNLGFKHTYLIHIFVALSLLHDTHITPNQPMPHRTALAFHWYQATVLFQQRLRAACGVDASSLPSSERDGLWVAGALLGAASIALIDVHDANALSDGKKVVWNITDPTRKESIFHELILDLDNMPFGNKPVPPKALPPIFYTMFNLSPESSAASNRTTSPPRYSRSSSRATSTTTPKLLEEKDPKAMVLLAWWYAKAVAHRSWWMQRRSLIEGRAICIYLEKYCKHVEGIQELVQFPKRVFGLSYTGRETKHTVGVDAARVDNPVY